MKEKRQKQPQKEHWIKQIIRNRGLKISKQIFSVETFQRLFWRWKRKLKVNFAFIYA